MSTNIEIVKGIYAAFGRGDVPAILEACDEGVTWGIDSVATEVPPYGVRDGRAGVGRFAAAWAENVDFTRFEADDFVAVGDHVFNRLSYELAVKSTGKALKNDSIQHWTLKNGRVVRWRGYEDTARTRDAFKK